MSTANPWEDLRYGDAQRGVAIIRQEYAHDCSPSRIMQLGVAYLWTGAYEAAWNHFQDAMVTHHQSLARFFGMAGTAKWCLDSPAEAVQWWKLGMGTDYADAAGNIHMPILLHAASVLYPAFFSNQEAKKLLEAKVENPRAVNWPGPLGQYVLGRIGLRTLESLSADNKTESVPPARRRIIGFYAAVRALESGQTDRTEFRETARQIVNLPGPEWNDQKQFLRLIWNEEYFIARHEGFAD